MKTTIKSLAVVTMLAGSSLFAQAQSFLSIGYANVSPKNKTLQGVNIQYGFKFGETMKQRLGLEYIMVNGDDKGQATLGNSADIYYAVGYEVYKNLTLNANMGYAYETVGSMGSGRNKVDIYATGMTYGGGIVYALGEHLDVLAEYKIFQLNYDLFGASFEQNKDVVSLSFAYNF